MAVCVFFNKKCTTPYSLKRVIDYVLVGSKTNDKLSFGFEVNAKNACEEMIAVEEAFHKTDKRQYVRFAISFVDMRYAKKEAKIKQVMLFNRHWIWIGVKNLGTKNYNVVDFFVKECYNVNMQYFH